jgi:hypothetical protein
MDVFTGGGSYVLFRCSISGSIPMLKLTLSFCYVTASKEGIGDFLLRSVAKMPSFDNTTDILR